MSVCNCTLSRPVHLGLLTEKAIRRGMFTSVKELEEKIHAFIQAHNAESKPFE